MKKRFYKRAPMAVSEAGYRRLRRVARDAQLEEGELISLIFENFSSVTDHDNLMHRMRLFKNELAAEKS